MKHSPLTILAMRLMAFWLVDEKRNVAFARGDLQHEVHYHNDSVTDEKSDHVEQVKFRVSSSCCRASNNVLSFVRIVGHFLLLLCHILLSRQGRHR